ncbi:MAG: 6-carboxytetrahydropterin synthase [Myxococcales bacterium]|nr:6-carboxytetrahydropterin synthase [Myxococcales bacterium]
MDHEPRQTPKNAEFSERHGIRLFKEYFNFGSAHFLIFADGTREELHGHNYRATLELDAALDAAWLVADFLKVKPVFRAVCDSLDHRTLLPLRNPNLKVSNDGREVTAWFGEDRYIIPTRDVCLLDIENTASELLARWICTEFIREIGQALPTLEMDRVLVTVQESPGQSALYERKWAR